MVKVMFLCTGNSCRSQMAEGFSREFGKGLIEPHSAGLMPSRVNTYAVRVMKESGIDISSQRSRAIDEELLRRMDVVITLCGYAEQMCPTTPPHIRRLHWPVDDPVGTIGSEDHILSEFRRARDEIREKVEKLIQETRKSGNTEK